MPDASRRPWAAYRRFALIPLGLLACSKPAEAPAPRPAVETTATVRPAAPAFDDLVRQAQGARDAGRLAEAAKFYQAALEERPDWTEGAWVLGLIFYQLKRPQEARDAFESVTLRTPDHGRSWAMKGLCEFQLGHHAVALQDLTRGAEKGLQGDPRTEAVAHYHRAILLTRAGSFEDGFKVLKALVPTAPDAPPLVEALGINLLRLAILPSDLPAAQKEMVQSAGRAGSLMLTQKRPAARKLFAQLVKSRPDTPGVHYAFGAFLKTEEPDAALREFREELRVSPEHVPARLQMALEYLSRGDHEAAVPLAREAAARMPQDAAARITYGRALLDAGQAAPAVAELEAGTQRDPGNAQAHFALAKAYAEVGRKDDAARARATFLKLSQGAAEQ